MEITSRGLWTLVHGMGFGALYLLACSGALFELYRATLARGQTSTPESDRFLRAYLLCMAVIAWATVFSGAYVVYPWYRAAPPAGMSNLAAYPQALLRSSPATAQWHSFGMEWKEHVAWIVPISITMVTATFFRFREHLRTCRQLRAAVLSFALVSFIAAGVAGFFGAMITKVGPVQGGSRIQLLHGDEK